jgi:ribosomal protein S18 acetylase RimI-like enzyme
MEKNNLQNIIIRKLKQDEGIPYALLLLADPSQQMVDSYIYKGEIHVVEQSREIIGVYVLLGIDDAVVEVKNIAVKDSHQGKGLGSLMLTDTMQKAVSLAYEKIIIGTANASVGQLYLYQKLGFDIIEIIKDFFVENYPGPIYENGILCKHMILLEKQL